MGKSSKHWAIGGEVPDWMDVEMALRAVDAVHSGTTMVTIAALGSGVNGGLCVRLTTTFEVLDGSPAIKEVMSERDTTSHTNDYLPAFILGGIYAHDFALSQAYQQRFLFK